MYWYKLYKEIKTWYLIYKIAKKNEQHLRENKLYVDWIGRIYTVINTPEELLNNKFAKDGYVLEQLREIDPVLLKLGISDAVYPESKEVELGSFLLVLTGPNDYFNTWSMLKNTGITGGILALLYFLISSNIWQQFL